MSCRLLAGFLALMAAACGSPGAAPSAPAPSPTPAGPPTMTITPSGVNPQVLHVFDLRDAITFVNGDGRPHDMRSDPHPAHTDCPSINVGLMMPGERREIDARSLPLGVPCYYHDDTDVANKTFQGVVLTH